MTAAGSTTTRGSGFFCVSLDSGRKVGVKAERSLEHLVAVQSPSHSKKPLRVYHQMGVINICKC